MGVRYMDMVTRHTKSTVKTCLFSSLLTGIGVSDFFEASCAEGQLSPSLSVSHRRSQFLGTLCPCVAMAHLSRLTALVARLPTHVSLPAAPSSRWLLLALGGVVRNVDSYM